MAADKSYFTSESERENKLTCVKTKPNCKVQTFDCESKLEFMKQAYHLSDSWRFAAKVGKECCTSRSSVGRRGKLYVRMYSMYEV